MNVRYAAVSAPYSWKFMVYAGVHGRDEYFIGVSAAALLFVEHLGYCITLAVIIQ